MPVPVLETRLLVPTPPPRAVHRPRLFQLLVEGLSRGRAVSLVAAPPGYGKTTLVADWLRRSERARA